MIQETVNGVPTGTVYEGPITVRHHADLVDLDTKTEPFAQMADARRRFAELVSERVESVYLCVGDRIVDSWEHSYDVYMQRAEMESHAPAGMESDELENWIDAQLGEE